MEKIKLILIPYMKWRSLDEGMRYTIKFVLGLGLIGVVLMLNGCKVQFAWDHDDPTSVAIYRVTTNGRTFFTVDQSITLDLDYDIEAYPCVSVIAYSYDLLASEPATLCSDDSYSSVGEYNAN